MGGTSSKKQSNNLWQTIDRGQHYDKVKNQDGVQGQQYNYILDNRYDPTSELQIYNERQKTALPLIKSLYAEYTQKGKGMIPQNNFRVITQDASHTLTSLPQLTYPQSLYVLDKSLQGYQHLYHKAGPFNVNSDMIAFNNDGQCKVWHNQNYGNNRPSKPMSVLQSTTDRNTFIQSQLHGSSKSQDQINMVRNIVNVVGDKCMQGKWPGLNDNPPSAFQSRIYSGIGFRQAREIISQTIQQERLKKVDRIDWRSGYVRTSSVPVFNNNINQTQVIHQQGMIRNSSGQFYPQSQRFSTYKFNYINPQEVDHPSIFASRIEMQ